MNRINTLYLIAMLKSELLDLIFWIDLMLTITKEKAFVNMLER
jgi:hypothetical protein